MPPALPEELERLAAALQQDSATAETAASIFTNSGRFRSDWASRHQLRADSLSLPIPRNQGLHPTGCDLQSANLAFQFEWREGHSVPWRAEYQVRVEGVLDADNALFELQDHWRLDTDMYGPDRRQHEDPPATASREPHPLFHFQRGGHAQTAFAAAEFLPGAPCTIQGVWRGLMQSPGPRIPVLPLDPILAIDFCLSQNDGVIWRRLHNIPEYYTVVEDAQERLWRPFFNSLQDAAFRRAWFGPSLLI
ncbi:hypothetical protein [Sphingomonas sp.]|uniref:hypothetical protein n=1 Tax=Sphingomonas sp. TaxID=28214 RepID=UPI003BAD7C01